MRAQHIGHIHYSTIRENLFYTNLTHEQGQQEKKHDFSQDTEFGKPKH